MSLGPANFTLKGFRFAASYHMGQTSFFIADFILLADVCPLGKSQSGQQKPTYFY